jgi:hypothetical protein
MIAGALEFVLGLEANKFLSNLGLAGGHFLSFMGAMEGVEKAGHKMWEAMEKGDALGDLAKRTGATVANIYQLQQAFEQTGVAAAELPGMLNRISRTLASDEGGMVLRSMGLDPEQLRKADPVAQIGKISQALLQFDKESGTQRAFALFGREGAANMMQIARSGEEFRHSISATAADAKVWDDVAPSFDHIIKKVEELKARMDTMWALMAGALIRAFETGRLGELLGRLFTDAALALGDVLLPILEKVGIVLMQAFEEPLTYLQAGMDYIAQSMLDAFTNIGEAFGKILNGDIKGALNDLATNPLVNPNASWINKEKWDQVLKERRESGVEFWDQGMNLNEMSKQADQDLNEGINKALNRVKGTAGYLKGLASELPKDQAEKAGKLEPQQFRQTQASSWERMGLVFDSGASGAVNFARRTADATERTSNNTQRVGDLLERFIRDSINQPLPIVA